MLLVTLATLITLTNSFGRVETDTLGAQIVSYVPIVLSDCLSLHFVMKNLGKESFPVTTGFHPYFSVSHPTNVTIFTEAGRIDCRGGMDGARSIGEGRYLLQDRGCGRTITLFSRGNTKLIVWNVGPEGTTLPGLAADDWKRYVCVEPAVVPRGGGFYLHPQDERELTLSVSVGRMNKES